MLDSIAVKAAATEPKEIPESNKTPRPVVARRERLLAVCVEPFSKGSRGFVHAGLPRAAAIPGPGIGR
ncbi:hypothetical protein DHEL01_v210585 [Diaporthe helianthi]|uniref:Uncharacterized protein n=1 Tax=Diaporthe helianthi TaxID=158607 RepID=A0A2P5HLB1_DIAHE|nr:hypothetical protein DHEL01_v210585 [Diaporthe helianthi]